MAIGFSTAVRNSRASVFLDALDAGSSNGEIRLYSGTQPTTGGALSGNTLLGTLELSSPAGVVTTGVFTFSTIADDTNADADGTISWARMVDSDGNFVADVDCGVTGSGAALIFNATTVTAGGVIRITSGTITEGNA